MDLLICLYLYIYIKDFLNMCLYIRFYNQKCNWDRLTGTDIIVYGILFIFIYVSDIISTPPYKCVCVYIYMTLH